MSIQRAQRTHGRFGISTEVSVSCYPVKPIFLNYRPCAEKHYSRLVLQLDMARSASSQDNDLLELELATLHETKWSMPEMSSRDEELTQSTTSEVADLTDNFNRPNPERNVCSVLHRSPSQFKRGV